MSHNPRNNYSDGNKLRYERFRPASEEAPAEVEKSVEICEELQSAMQDCSETESFEETKFEESAQDAVVVSEEPDVAQKTEIFVEEDSEVLAIVANCRKLNIREAPSTDADIVTILPAGSEVMVDEKHSNDNFYKVCTAIGIEGYCMKQYIELRG